MKTSTRRDDVFQTQGELSTCEGKNSRPRKFMGILKPRMNKYNTNTSSAKNKNNTKQRLPFFRRLFNCSSKNDENNVRGQNQTGNCELSTVPRRQSSSKNYRIEESIAAKNQAALTKKQKVLEEQELELKQKSRMYREEAKQLLETAREADSKESTVLVGEAHKFAIQAKKIREKACKATKKRLAFEYRDDIEVLESKLTRGFSFSRAPTLQSNFSAWNQPTAFTWRVKKEAMDERWQEVALFSYDDFNPLLFTRICGCGNGGNEVSDLEAETWDILRKLSDEENFPTIGSWTVPTIITTNSSLRCPSEIFAEAEADNTTLEAQHEAWDFQRDAVTPFLEGACGDEDYEAYIREEQKMQENYDGKTRNVNSSPPNNNNENDANLCRMTVETKQCDEEKQDGYDTCNTESILLTDMSMSAASDTSTECILSDTGKSNRYSVGKGNPADPKDIMLYPSTSSDALQSEPYAVRLIHASWVESP